MSHGHGSVDYVRKFFVLFCLFGSLLGLYYIAPNSDQGVGLLALGFVILSAFLIGQVVEIVKLPHITGYLLAGVFLGPSLGETLHKIFPNVHLLPPFDHGILNFKVIDNLSLLDTLALPLICISAGGALQPKEIKKALKPILGVLSGQVITMFLGMMGLFYLMSGPIPFFALPALQGLSLSAVLALGAVVAAVSIATSDAATIAIVISTKSKGPMTTNIVSVAVLKDIVVVVAFAATTVIATSALGLDSGTSLGDSIFRIILSAIFGVVLGYLIRLYMKYVNAELLLFVITLIYTVSFICDVFHLESALLFIAAGFIVANGPNKGGSFISEIEKLSTPVFVVFFTIAGAKLHLDVLVEMALFAFLLVGVRTLAFYIGCRVGAVLTNADAATREYAWMGFVSQAGLAITLANSFIPVYGPELGGALFSFILGGVAIHEIIGPALLQSALQKAGEVPSANTEQEGTPTDIDVLDSISDFTDINLPTFATKFQGILDIYLQKCEEHFDHRIQAIQNQQFESSTLLQNWSPSLIIDIDNEVETFPVNLYVELEGISFTKNDSDSLLQSLLRSIQRFRYKLRPWKREIDLRNLARYHAGGKIVGSLKDIVLELSKLERSWAISYSDGDFDIEVIQRDKALFFENLNRKFRIIKSNFVVDMRLISTIDLRSWQRRTSLIFNERNETQIFLSTEIDKLRTHIDSLWKKVILQNTLSDKIHHFVKQLQTRHIQFPEFPDSELTDLSWQSKHEQLLQLQREISHIPNEIEHFMQIIFDDLPSSIVYTPDSIDVDLNNTMSNIQLQSNLIHLMDHSIGVELTAKYTHTSNILSKHIHLYKEVIDIQEMDLDDELSQSIERYRNRIVENHSMVQETLSHFRSEICLLLLNSIPNMKTQFSSNPNKTDLLIETSNFWQKILQYILQVLSQLQNDFHPIYLSDYAQLINNQKLGYPQPFTQILLQESTEALIHSKDSLIVVGSPTQISQIIIEFSEEIPNCTRSLEPQKNQTYVCEDISQLSSDEIFKLERYLLSKRKAIIGVPRYHWSYVQRKYSLHKIVKEKRVLGKFSYKNIRDILIHRHNFSGYKLNFATNPKYVLDPIFNTSPEKRFFMWLHKQCDGNIEFAYEIWKRCLKTLDNDVLMIDYASKSEFLEVLSDDTLLILRQILRFSTVKIQDLEYWYGCSTIEAQIIITELLNKDLLEIVPSKSNYYRIPLHKQPLLFERLRTHGWGV